MRAGTDDWDRHWKAYGESAARNPAQEYRRRLIFELFSSGGPPSRVLDIGAGAGDLAAYLRRKFPATEFLGLELSRIGVELARRKLPDATFLQRDLLQPHAPEPKYRGWATDAVCSEVLEHVDEPELVLANARPYLAPHARLVVTVPGGPISAFDRHIGHRRHYSRSTLGSLLEEAGFAVERVLAAGFPFFNLYRLVVVLRGRRLVDDVANGSNSPAARAVMRAFHFLFRLNADESRWGWQIVASARLRNHG